MSKGQLHSMGKLARQFIEYLRFEGPSQAPPKSSYEHPREETL